MIIPNNLTMIVSHPDDEVIFGWGVIKHVKKIIYCSTDRFNIDKPQWKDRCTATEEIGKLLNIEIINLDYNSDFYKLQDSYLDHFLASVNSAIKSETCLFTHNAWGEYGHLDHIFLHSIIKQSEKSMITSNIMVNSKYTGFVSAIKPQISDSLDVTNDLKLYSECRSIYKNYNCWTWHEPPIYRAKLYIVQ